MPLRLDISQQLHNRSDRVKCVDMHPSEPWMLVALYSGVVNVWNYETKTLIKTFEVCDVPVRAARFVQRKNWVITGSDDMKIRIFNYNTLEKIHSFEAHTDYIRSIAVHPSQPYVLSSSDDMSIRMWDWEANWTCRQVFEGHSHYVMSVIFNPKDVNTFASCSLDRTIKVWQLGSRTPNFTLPGHDKGVNCIAYFQGGEKPYLASGADDNLVKIWDYQSKSCVQTLEAHSENVTAVCFHPELPVILTGSEDGTVRVWHSSTYSLENTLSYRMERVWTMAFNPGTNSIAVGYDEGSVLIKVGREEPAMSMDKNGKIIMARHNEIQMAIPKQIKDVDVEDGEILSLPTKDLGSCEIYPQSLAHNPKRGFVVVCGDGEYIIHTSISFRNKSFGQALDFVWGVSTEYATRESTSVVKVFKDFQQLFVLKPDFRAEQIFGGSLLGVKGPGFLSFYQWASPQIVRRIEIDCQDVYWNEAGDRVIITTKDEGCFILKYTESAVQAALQSEGGIDEEEGVEEAFEVVDELDDSVRTGTWVGSCFIYTNNGNRLNYYVGGEIVTVAHLDRPMYILGYMSEPNRVYLGDKDLNVVTYRIPLPVLEYQTAVMEGDFTTADKLMSKIPEDHLNRVGHFLEAQGYKEQALVVSKDPEHRFELALALHKLAVARDVAEELQSKHKWKLLADVAMKKSMFDLAEECLAHARDFNGQLLLYSSSGKADKLAQLASDAKDDGRHNIAFVSLMLLGKVDECIELLLSAGRIAEAAMFARTYKPSAVSAITKQWKESISATHPKVAQSLADPEEYGNLFPEYEDSVALEKAVSSMDVNSKSAQETAAIIKTRAVPLAERVAATNDDANNEGDNDDDGNGEDAGDSNDQQDQPTGDTIVDDVVEEQEQEQEQKEDEVEGEAGGDDEEEELEEDVDDSSAPPVSKDVKSASDDELDDFDLDGDDADIDVNLEEEDIDDEELFSD